MKYIKFLGNSKHQVPEKWNVSNYKYYTFTKTLPDESTVTGMYKTRGLIRNGKQEIIIVKENGVTKTEYAFLDKKGESYDIYDVNGTKTGSVVSEKYQDPANGHKYVEIGGLKWATVNIGAKSPTDFGLYFAWGETQGYTAEQCGDEEGQRKFSMNEYKYATNIQDNYNADMTKYNSTDNKTVLDLSDDAASVNWGGYWRIPTKEEIDILISSTTNEYVTNYQGSGVSGRLLTSKEDESIKIFFPTSGHYHTGRFMSEPGFYKTSSLSENNIMNSYVMNIFGYTLYQTTYQRYVGSTIRPILDYQEEQETPSNGINTNGHDYVDLGLPSGTLWANINVGALSETGYGNYYQFGKGADPYEITNGTIDYEGTEPVLDLSVDTARQVWGGDWTMATAGQFGELLEYTTHYYVQDFNNSGISGEVFISTSDDTKYIFLPGGNYWTSNSKADDDSVIFQVDSYLLNLSDGRLRNEHSYVRPVITPKFSPNNNQIIYFAYSQIQSGYSMDPRAFSSTIQEHTFNNGIGIITCEEDLTYLGSDYGFFTSPDYYGGTYQVYKVLLPTTITSLGGFGGTSITELNIPESVRTIIRNGLYSSYDLKNINSLENITSIDDSAFANCGNIEHLVFGSNIESIGDAVISAQNSNLKTVTIKATTPPVTDDHVFDKVTYHGGSASYVRLPQLYAIFVPSESVDSYKAAVGWESYADIIYAIGTEVQDPSVYNGGK